MILTHELWGEPVTIEWEKSVFLRKEDQYRYYLMIGVRSDGIEYEGVGNYLCGELQGITNIETI